MKKIKLIGIDLDLYYKKLKNGLAVYFIPYKYKKNYFLSFATKFGSIIRDFAVDDNSEIKTYPLGIAHFLEHKIFEMEDGIDPFQVFNETGTEANANTNYEVTKYICYGNNSIEKNLEYLLDYVSKPYFTDENVEKEKGIIKQEIEMYDDEADWVLDEALRKALFKVHPYRDDIAGTVEEIYKITKEDLYDCYNAFYNPHNMMLFVAGNIDIKKLVSIVDNYDKKYPSKETNPKIKSYNEPDNVYKKKLSIKHNIVLPKLAYGIKIPLVSLRLDDIVKIKMYLNMFISLKFGGTSLFREKALKDELMTALFVECNIIDKFAVLSFFSDTDHSLELLKKIKDELLKNDIDDSDIERLKKVWIASEVQCSDNIRWTVNGLIADIIKYGDIINNKIDLIRGLNKKEFYELINNIDFSNSSVVYMNPIDSIKDN